MENNINNNRYLTDNIESDLQNKMVFLAGPRQVGKTTLAKNIIGKLGGFYYLWDNSGDRKAMMKAEWPAENTIIALDEIHKYRKWKQWIKGEYDKHKEHLKFIVTGSARMDVYRKGGDSLQGRYHHYRLHPFSYNELLSIRKNFTPMTDLNFSDGTADRNVVDSLFNLSGFPEPIFAGDERTHRRWQKERMERFFREDVRDLENVRDLSAMQLLSDMIPDKVGSPLSLNSMREDIDASHRAVTNWVDIMNRLYFLFKVRPYTGGAIKGLKKEAKVYLWDWTLVSDSGHRFENMIASHLLKFCNYLEDTEGYKMELCYLRDTFKREVDFLVTCNRKPWFMVEAKTSDETIAPSLYYYKERLSPVQTFQVTMNGSKDYIKDEIRVMPVGKFLSALV